MAADWSGMESALKSYFEDISEPNDAKTFTAVGQKIAGEYASAIGGAKDDVSNPVLSVPGESGVATAFTAEFQAQMNGASPSFSGVIDAVTACNMGLVLGFTNPDASVSMVTTVSNAMTDGGSGDSGEYKSAFAMSDNMTAAKSAELITKAMKNHFSGNKTLLTGATSAPSPVTSALSLS